MNEREAKRPRPEIDDPAACTGHNLRRASRAMTQVYDAALAPSGLKSTQFNLLAALAKLGELPLTRLAEALVLDRTTLTRNLRPLIEQGLIRSGGDEDRRVRRLSLTAKGRRKFEQALPHWRGAQERLVTDLGPERWARLLDDLDAAVETARRH